MTDIDPRNDKKSPPCSKTLTYGRATGNSFLRSGKMSIWGMTEFYWLSKGDKALLQNTWS